MQIFKQYQHRGDGILIMAAQMTRDNMHALAKIVGGRLYDEETPMPTIALLVPHNDTVIEQRVELGDFVMSDMGRNFRHAENLSFLYLYQEV